MNRTIVGALCVGLLLSYAPVAIAQSTPPALSTFQPIAPSGEPKAPPLTAAACIEALGGAALAVLLIAVLLLRSRARWLVIGEDNRYSNSKCQMALWFWTVL